MKRLIFITAAIVFLQILFCIKSNVLGSNYLNDTSKVETVVQNDENNGLQSLTLNYNSKLIICSGYRSSIIIYDILTGKKLRTIYTEGNIKEIISYSFCDKIISVQDSLMIVWDIITGNKINEIKTKPLKIIKNSKEGNNFITVDIDNKIAVWDFEQLKRKFIITERGLDIADIAISKKGNMFILADKDGNISLWDIVEMRKVKDLFTSKNKEVDFNNYTYNLELSNNGKYLSICSGEKIEIWNLESRKMIGKIYGSYYFSKFTPDNNGIISSGFINENDSLVTHYIDLFGNIKKTFRQKVFADMSAATTDLLLINDRLFISGALNYEANYIQLWDIYENKILKEFKGVVPDITSFDLNPDDIISYCTQNESISKINICNLEIVNFINIKKKASIIKYDKYLEKYLVGLQNGEIIIFDNNGNKLFELIDDNIDNNSDNTGNSPKKAHEYKITSLCYFAENNLLLSGSGDGLVKLWDLNSNKLLKSFIGEDFVYRYTSLFVSFSNSGKDVICRNSTGLVQVWNINSGNKVSEFEVGVNEGFYDQQFSNTYFTKDLNNMYVVRGEYIGSSIDYTIIDKYDLLTFNKVCSYKIDLKYIEPYCLSLSSDEKYIITGYSNGNIIFVNQSTKIIEKILKSNYSVFNIKTFQNSDNILVYTSNRSFEIWNYKSENIIAYISPVLENNFVLLTPDNYYAITKGGYKGIAFREGNIVYPFEQFDLQYNRPDIVLNRLGCALPEVIESYKKAYEKRLKKMNFNEEMFNKDFHTPEIMIMNKNLTTIVKDKVIKLDIQSWDTKYNLNRLNVYNNDVPIYGTNGISLNDKNTSKYDDSIKINLINGKNKIQVSVLNNKGVESLKETVEIFSEVDEKKPNLYVLAIGTSDYNDSKYKLTYAAKDAKDLAELFKNKQGEYGEVKVMKLLDKEVIKENILKAKEFLMESKVDDEVIVFIAGHGLLNKDFDYYYATCDIDFQNPEARGITFDEIEALLDGIPALKKILFMDTCHSGEVDKDEIEEIKKQNKEVGEVTFRAVGDIEYQEKNRTKLGLKNTNQLLQELFVDLRRGSGAMVISSAGGMEFAWESGDFKNGLFTYSLLDGLKNQKADLNSDGIITVSELKDYISMKVEELTNGKQKPTSRRENLENDFRIW